MAVRPTGTVTFLLTDIEGSTRLWEDHPAEMESAVARHDEILRHAIEAEGGYVLTTAGDSFAASFERAGDAVAAAIGGQEQLAAEPWRGSHRSGRGWACTRVKRASAAATISAPR